MPIRKTCVSIAYKLPSQLCPSFISKNHSQDHHILVNIISCKLHLNKAVFLVFYLNKFIYLFIYFWLYWVFISVRGLSLVAASGGHSSSQCAGLSLSWPLLLRSTGSIHAGSVVVAHGRSCSAACGICPDQGSNLCPLHWQADSQPLRHQGSPKAVFKKIKRKRNH